MKKIKLICQIVAAFVIALFAYNIFYQPHSESVKAQVKQKLPAVLQQEDASKGLPEGKLRITMLNIGQGDALLLQDGKQTVMVDVGDSRARKSKDGKVSDNGGKDALVKALDKAGVKRINTVIVTHHHSDHMGNIMYVRGKYSVKNIYDSGYPNNNFATSVKLHEDLRAGMYNNRVLKAGDTVKLGQNYYLEVLAPGDFLDKRLYKNINNTSLVMMLHYGDFKMLLTGDAEKGVEGALVQKYGSKLQADVLKVGHHGSQTSSIWQFVQAVKPKYALISCGPFEIFHHPNKDVLGRLKQSGAKALTTFDHGSITVTTDGKSFDVQTER